MTSSYNPGAVPAAPLTGETSAVPTLKVMRLQKPELHMPTAGSLDGRCLLGTALCLPDSFGVIHVGETFTAYLGALNTSRTLPVSRLTIAAQLQTPSQRWHLASRLDGGNAAGGVEVPPDSGVDAIVSHSLEEAGQHILRVEVSYAGGDGATLSLRKFYRFQVSNPLVLSDRTYRVGDLSCFVSLSLENRGTEVKSGLTVCSADFDPAPGLVAETIGIGGRDGAAVGSGSNGPSAGPARTLFDNSGRLEAGESKSFLFKVTVQPPGSAANPSAAARGIAAGDELGRAVFTWRKACGEMGRMVGSPVVCPDVRPALDPADPEATMTGRGSDFVVHTGGGSGGLSIDVATHAAARAANPGGVSSGRDALDLVLPVTVEPIDPPNKMELGVPCQISFLVVNHSDLYLTLQLQFQLDHMEGISVCGPSFQNLEEIASNGGSATVQARFMALSAGLLQLSGCCVVDLASGLAIPQPPLFKALVEELSE